MSATATAPGAKNLAPNNPAGPDKKAWKDEIHTPAAEYNANVPLADIVPDPRNRKDHDAAALQSLTDQIKAEGLLQPILIRPIKNSQFMIIAGERRFLACKKLKWLTIPAMIRKSETDLSAARKQAIENEGREDLNPIGRARNYARLIELGDKQKDLMELFKVSQPVISNTLRLLELPGPVQILVAAKSLSHAHGVALVRFAKWKKVCLRIAECAIAHDYDAKSIAGGFPFAGTLAQEGIIEQIRIDKGYDWEDRPTYKLPPQFKGDPDFIYEGGDLYYVLPTDEKAPNKWAPEKAKQDKAREEAEAKRKAKNAQALTTGKLTTEQLDRRKKIANNKTARIKIAQCLGVAETKLKAGKSGDIETACALVCQKASARGYGADFKGEAIRLEIKLPAKFDGYKAASWASLKIGDALRLVAYGIVCGRAAEATRYAGGVPDEIELFTGGKAK